MVQPHGLALGNLLLMLILLVVCLSFMVLPFLCSLCNPQVAGSNSVGDVRVTGSSDK